MQMTVCSHLSVGTPSDARRLALRRRLPWLMLLSMLLALTVVEAMGQQMQVKKNQLLVLHLGAPVGDMEDYNGDPAYRSLIQENPFIEVKLIQPLPVKKLHRGRMIFVCAEVGIYTDASGRTWTIGKGCRPR